MGKFIIFKYDPDYQDDYGNAHHSHSHSHGYEKCEHEEHESTAHEHHHHGVLWSIARPFLYLYHRYYTPYLDWLGNKLGGRKNAGRVGRYATLLRFFGNALTLAALIALILIVGFSTVWTLGMAAPIWALVLGFCGISFNTAGFMIRSAANHLKIEPYYHTELWLHHENNKLRVSLGEKSKHPDHGMSEAPRPKWWMYFWRYLHDMNGAAGTLASTLSTIFELFSVLIDMIGIIFMGSRISALVSVIFAPITNQHRLYTYKRIISKKINEYYELKYTKDTDKHTIIYAMVSDVFKNIKINKDHYYARWVHIRCYRVIDEYFKEGEIKEDDKSIIIKKLEEILKRYIKAENNECRFSRHALMHIMPNEKLCVLDSMTILESCMRDALYPSSNTKVDDYFNQHMDTSDSMVYLFMLHLKHALAARNIKDINEKQIINVMDINKDLFCNSPNPLSKKLILNKNKISQAYPFNGPHGAQFIPDHHAKELVDNIFIPCLSSESEENANVINTTVNDFYLAHMDILDANSALFVLQLKCTLIQNALNKTIVISTLAMDLEKIMADKPDYFSIVPSTATKKYILNATNIAKDFKQDHCVAKKVIDGFILPKLTAGKFS